MKSTDPDLIALLNTGKFVTADLYTITLATGEVLLYTTADIDIIVGSNKFLSHSVRIDDPNQRALGHWKTGLDVDTWQVSFFPRDIDPLTGTQFPDQIGDQPWLAAATAGALDGATVEIQRAYQAAWPSVWTRQVAVEAKYVIIIFLGRMAEVDLGRSYAVLNVNDYRDLLSMLMPHNLFQSGCRHTLFDAGCTLLASSYTTDGVVTSSAANVINDTAITNPDGYFSLGRLTMTSGGNNGFGRQVRSYSSGAFSLIAPFPFAVEIGDTFTVTAGCDKTKSTCTTKFSNVLNFGGFPDIPAPETAT